MYSISLKCNVKHATKVSWLRVVHLVYKVILLVSRKLSNFFYRWVGFGGGSGLVFEAGLEGGLAAAAEVLGWGSGSGSDFLVKVSNAPSLGFQTGEPEEQSSEDGQVLTGF